MAISHEYRLECPQCGQQIAAHLADSINVARTPETKRALLERRLNRVECSACGTAAIVEKDLLYVDPQRQLRVAVAARPETSPPADLDDYLTHRVPNLEALREIVVADDHGISSERLRLFKVYLHSADPRLHLGSSRLFLDNVGSETLSFLRLFSDDIRPMKVEIARVALEAMFAGRDAVKEVPQEGIFARLAVAFGYLGARPDPSRKALETLANYAQQAETGGWLDLAGSDFQTMLKALPPADRLSREAQADLDVIFAQAISRAQDHALLPLFGARFGFSLDPDWLRNHSLIDVPVLWAALRDLPDAAVERNGMLESLQLEPGRRGLYFEATRRIEIGEAIVDGGIASLRHCILHEVGHAMHASLDRDSAGTASAWLAREFGWKVYDPRLSEGIDGWVNAMGGYPPGASLLQQQQVRHLIRQSMGGTPSFVAPPIANHPQPHPWNDPAFGPRAAFENTGSDWWLRCEAWHLVEGQRFFVNYNYGLLMEVSDETMRFVAAHAPDRYALSAPQEFFAEMFAWFYDMNHPSRTAIPKRIETWLTAHVGPPDGAGLLHSWL